MKPNFRSLLAKLIPTAEKTRITLKLIAGNLFLLFLCLMLADCIPDFNKELSAVIHNPRSFTLSWTEASDSHAVEYDFYYSDKPDIKTLEEIKANGTLYMPGWLETSFRIYDARPGADIYVNIVALDTPRIRKRLTRC